MDNRTQITELQCHTGPQWIRTLSTRSPSSYQHRHRVNDWQQTAVSAAQRRDNAGSAQNSAIETSLIHVSDFSVVFVLNFSTNQCRPKQFTDKLMETHRIRQWTWGNFIPHAYTFKVWGCIIPDC